MFRRLLLRSMPSSITLAKLVREQANAFGNFAATRMQDGAQIEAQHRLILRGRTGGAFRSCAPLPPVGGGDDLAAVEAAVLDENVGVFLPPTTTPAT